MKNQQLYDKIQSRKNIPQSIVSEKKISEQYQESNIKNSKNEFFKILKSYILEEIFKNELNQLSLIKEVKNENGLKNKKLQKKNVKGKSLIIKFEKNIYQALSNINQTKKIDDLIKNDYKNQDLQIKSAKKVSNIEHILMVNNQEDKLITQEQDGQNIHDKNQEQLNQQKQKNQQDQIQKIKTDSKKQIEIIDENQQHQKDNKEDNKEDNLEDNQEDNKEDNQEDNEINNDQNQQQFELSNEDFDIKKNENDTNIIQELSFNEDINKFEDNTFEQNEQNTTDDKSPKDELFDQTKKYLKKRESIKIHQEINKKDFDSLTLKEDIDEIDRNDEYFIKKKISFNLQKNIIDKKEKQQEDLNEGIFLNHSFSKDKKNSFFETNTNNQGLFQLIDDSQEEEQSVEALLFNFYDNIKNQLVTSDYLSSIQNQDEFQEFSKNYSFRQSQINFTMDEDQPEKKFIRRVTDISELDLNLSDDNSFICALQNKNSLPEPPNELLTKSIREYQQQDDEIMIADHSEQNPYIQQDQFKQFVNKYFLIGQSTNFTNQNQIINENDKRKITQKCSEFKPLYSFINKIQF